MSITVTDEEVRVRKVSIPKKELLTVLQRQLESLSASSALDDITDYEIKCWNHKGTHVCDDIEQIEVIVTRKRNS